MNKAVKQFANNAIAKRYFSKIRKNSGILRENKEYAQIAFASFFLEDNTIIAKSTYHTEYTLEKMLNSKGKEY